MNKPRFYVASVTGWTINPEGKSPERCATSYSVLDSAQNHLEVFTAYVGYRLPLGHQIGRGNTSEAERRAACEREAARRNALDAAGLPA